MFGFNKENKEKQQRNKSINMANDIVRGAILGQYGTDNPEIINRIWRAYMPEITNAILNTDKGVIQATRNQGAINENINIKHDEVMEELKSLRLQNKELQEKYNSLVERMAGYIEKENSKGR